MQTAQRERLLRREFPSSGRSPDAILDVFREEILAHPWEMVVRDFLDG